MKCQRRKKYHMTTNPNKSVLNQIKLDYQPDDFFYYHSNLTPSSVDCKTQGILNSCNIDDPNWNDMSFNCYQKELCLNRDLAQSVSKSQQTNLETGTREIDIDTIYNRSKIDTVNYIAGIASMVFILTFTS